jgi:hypothetical protein
MGVAVTLDGAGRARFRGKGAMFAPAARRLVERQGDLIEALLLSSVQGGFDD